MSSPLPPDYAERVYAGWIGKCIGVRLGAPLENWTYDEIRANLGEVTDFLPLPPGKLFKPDDDANFAHFEAITKAVETPVLPASWPPVAHRRHASPDLAELHRLRPRP